MAGLKEFVRGLPHVARLGVLYSTDRAEAERFTDELAGTIPRDQILLAQFSPVIGTHLGPGAMGVCVFEGEVT